jgi:DNA adenine methylase
MGVPSPLNWFGSKSRLASKIVAHFPVHHTYVEPFGGSAAVLLTKEPAQVEVYNDLDGELVNFFRVVRDPKLCAKLHASAECTLYARAEFELATQISDDPLEAAKRFMVRQRMSFGGKGRDWCYSVENSRRGTAAAIRRWRWGVDSLPAVHDRFKDVQIECADWRTVISRYDSPDTLLFCDPPYLPETRVAGAYRHELTHDDHRNLVASILSVRGMVILCGYSHHTYNPLERAGWARLDHPTCDHVSGSLTRRVESLWLSPSVARNGRNRKLFLSSTEKMSEGAHQAHKVMVAATTKKVLRAIERLRADGKKPTATRLSRVTKMSREHLARKYRHLFATGKV